MSLTSRFKFSFFGGPGSSGSLSDDGMKFTSGDRVLLDRLLATVEAWRYRFRPGLVGSPAAPTAELLDGSGMLQGGLTYFYRYGIVDANGNETLASAEVSVETPTPLPPPGIPVLLTEGEPGALASGSYYYALTALRGEEESTLGPGALVSLQPGLTSISVHLPPAGDATRFRVWRMGANESNYTKIGLTEPGAATFLDTGAVGPDPCACDPQNLPPQSSQGISRYAIGITVDPDLLEGARSWRLYRSTYPGIFPAATLVHDVVERVAEWDENSPLQSAWLDTGGPLQVGTPMLQDLNMRMQPFTFDTLSDVPDMLDAIATPGAAEGFPEGYPVLAGEALYAVRGGDFVPISSAGGGGGDMSPIMTSPNGNRFILGVDDNGALVTTPTNFPGPPAPVQNVTVA